MSLGLTPAVSRFGWVRRRAQSAVASLAVKPPVRSRIDARSSNDPSRTIPRKYPTCSSCSRGPVAKQARLAERELEQRRIRRVNRKFRCLRVLSCTALYM